MTLVLTQHWSPGATDRHTPEQPDEAGRPGHFDFRVINLGPDPVTVQRLCYASMTRPGLSAQVTGARLSARLANHVALGAPAPFSLAPGAAWEIRISGLTHAPLNHSQGAMAAWLETPDGTALPVRCEGLRSTAPPLPRRDWPGGAPPLPLAVLPWPREVAITAWQAPRPYTPAQGLDPRAFDAVAGLHQRLFPGSAPALSHGGGIAVAAVAGDLCAGGYRLDFTAEAVRLTHADAQGLRHGLVTLAQIAHGALTDARFRLPAAGHIADAPRFGWRGCHIDVARNFRPIGDLHRLADILAWHKMNQLHLHLTDDEAWRLESAAFPDLARIGGTRARGAPLLPQYGDGADGQQGHYSRTAMAALVAHCTHLGIAVTPEIDLPGHAYALMQAVPGLRDPDEPRGSYRSVQGYPDNALNPALARSYAVVETLLEEICALFPGPVVHLGGDEVDDRAWARSPAAQALRAARSLGPGAAPLQALFLRRVQAMLRTRGKIMGGWDECAGGGGVARDGALLFAWRDTARTAALLEQGYRVVATPGQAYYLDMMQASGWAEPGTSWAGAVSPQDSYAFEVTQGLPAGHDGLAGIQACIWSEHLDTRARWNYMVFPRLSAVAEAAWTPPAAKNWPRFCALARLMPQL